MDERVHLLKIIAVLDSVVDDFGGLFSNNVGLSSGLGLIALDIEPFNKNSVNWYQVTRLNVNHIADENIKN